MNAHTCRSEHRGVLADDCGRCAEHAEAPFRSLDNERLEAIVRVAVDPARFSRLDVTENDLVAAKHVLNAIDHVGKLLEVLPAVVIEDLRRRWRSPIVLERGGS